MKQEIYGIILRSLSLAPLALHDAYPSAVTTEGDQNCPRLSYIDPTFVASLLPYSTPISIVGHTQVAAP